MFTVPQSPALYNIAGGKNSRWIHLINDTLFIMMPLRALFSLHRLRGGCKIREQSAGGVRDRGGAACCTSESCRVQKAGRQDWFRWNTNEKPAQLSLCRSLFPGLYMIYRGNNRVMLRTSCRRERRRRQIPCRTKPGCCRSPCRRSAAGLRGR